MDALKKGTPLSGDNLLVLALGDNELYVRLAVV